jgi:hypothetical protein
MPSNKRLAQVMYFRLLSSDVRFFVMPNSILSQIVILSVHIVADLVCARIAA